MLPLEVEIALAGDRLFLGLLRVDALRLMDWLLQLRERRSTHDMAVGLGTLCKLLFPSLVSVDFVYEASESVLSVRRLSVLAMKSRSRSIIMSSSSSDISYMQDDAPLS